MNRHTVKTIKQLAGSWSRSFVAAVLACYMAGATEPKVLLSAGIAAVAPAAFRYFNPKDPLGR